MFTGNLTVDRLKADQISTQEVEDINKLLRKQRQDARLVTEESLIESLKKMGVIVVWTDDRRIVGIGALTRSEGLNFECAEIRHLIVADGLDATAVGMRIVQALRNIYLHCVEYIDAGAWVQDEYMKQIFTALHFNEKPGTRFRLRLVRES